MSDLDVATEQWLIEVNHRNLAQLIEAHLHLLAERDALAARVAAVEAFASSRAVAAHAVGDGTRERTWLDLLIVIERATGTDATPVVGAAPRLTPVEVAERFIRKRGSDLLAPDGDGVDDLVALILAAAEGEGRS